MFIKKIELKNFRNYSELNIDLNSDKVLFIGKNAQGKTNILEAVYYLSSLESFRAKTNIELIRHGESSCSAKAVINKYDTDIDIEAQINPPAQRKLKVNGITKNKTSDFIKNLSCVCFTSNDLMIVRGAPDYRRRYIDAAVSRIFPAYIERIAKYSRIKTQKNNYLKTLKGNIHSDTGMLDIWNEQLAVTGSNIIYIRLNFLHELQKTAAVRHLQISGGEDLALEYNSSIIGNISALNKFEYDAEYILERFIKQLEEKKQEEIIRMQCVSGPHRDDISFYACGKNAAEYASQGQQRTIVLSLKLSELELIKEKTHSQAVLLLDDVLAELDGMRQNCLLEAADCPQTIITSVDTLHFKEKYIKNAEIFEIKNNNAFKKA